MLETRLQLHRPVQQAATPNQKLFVAIHLQPNAEAAQARPPLALAFVIDTSGSMREVIAGRSEPTGETQTIDGHTYRLVTGGITKMNLVQEGLRSILASSSLRPEDRVSLIRFDTSASVLAPFTTATDRDTLLQAVDSLSQYEGETRMGAGLQLASGLLAAMNGAPRVVLVTDGHAQDEALVSAEADRLAARNVPVTVIGVGDWNEEPMLELTGKTRGTPFHVMPDEANPDPPAIRASALPATFLAQFKQAELDVITDVRLSVRTTADVKLEQVTRVLPEIAEVVFAEQPIPIGNVNKNGGVDLILQFLLGARSASRVRVAQLGFTFQVPGVGYRGEVPPQDVIVEFSSDPARATAIDEGVMALVQQRNVNSLVDEGMRLARLDPARATVALDRARAMTVKLGNTAMTVSLDRALDQLNRGELTEDARKTVRIGARTQTMRAGDTNGVPDDETIRRLTGSGK